MPPTVQPTGIEYSCDFLDVPSPGKPPKSDPWWKFRRQTPGVVLSKSEERVRWGWANYARYKKLFAQSNILTGSLKTMEDSLLVEHQRYLDGLEKAMEEKSNAKNEVQPRTVKRIAANAKHFQKHSKRFTDTALSEVHARAAGRTHYPSPDAPQSHPQTTLENNPSLSDQQLTGEQRNLSREGRYRRAPSLGNIGEAFEMSINIGLAEANG